ncbi:hypothetical protein FOZ61_007366 [Perkinsus olseni]|uniref:Uncharacterized protein n=1 Tax=Perkinsus olseni TaxID=32597 RepID=A0A7J6L991_PEROL|nr:hypothetical protein FOZ61_007366 [Perkinsus olseni]
MNSAFFSLVPAFALRLTEADFPPNAKYCSMQKDAIFYLVVSFVVYSTEADYPASPKYCSQQVEYEGHRWVLQFQHKTESLDQMYISHWWHFKMHYSGGISYTGSRTAKGAFVVVDVSSGSFTSFASTFNLDPEKWKVLPYNKQQNIITITDPVGGSKEYVLSPKWCIK